jgi:hypothetical protein
MRALDLHGSLFPSLAAALVDAAACADPGELDDRPDATPALVDAATPGPDAGGGDADGGFRVQSINLAPAGGEARSEDHQITGGLVPAATVQATSSRHRLRGRLGVLAP